LREERKLRVFENTVLRRIFGPRRDEVTGEWRRLHNEELNDLAEHVARMGREREVYKFLVRIPEGKRPLGRPRHRWVDNIRMICRRLDVGIWTGLGWSRVEKVGGRL